MALFTDNIIDIESIEQMDVGAIKEELKSRGLKRTGNKAELIRRLKAALILDESKEEDNEEEYEQDEGVVSKESTNQASTSKGEAKGEERVKNDKARASSGSSEVNRINYFSFKDVEDCVRGFDGSGAYPIEKWINEIEEFGQIMKWDELNIFIFARKMLAGLAKLFIMGETQVNNWRKLKKLLVEEFKQKFNSKEIHEMLSARVKAPSESLQEYFIIMKELASRGDIDSDSLIHYIIDGIPDFESNKSILYGARTLAEFRFKLKDYETMKSKLKKNILPRCYNCNTGGHTTDNCLKPKRAMGACFNCGSREHRVATCPGNESKKNREPMHCIDTACNHIDTDATVECQFTVNENDTGNQLTLNSYALIDSGSPISLIRSECVPSDVTLMEPPLNNFVGINKSKLNIFGIIKGSIIVKNIETKLQLYVVPNNAVSYNFILGRDFIFDSNLIVEMGDLGDCSIKIRKTDKCESGILPDIFNIESEPFDRNSTENLLINENLDEATKTKVVSLFQNFYIAPSRPEKPKIQFEMNISVCHTQPFYFNPRRLSYAEKLEIRKITDNLLDSGVIRPSQSEYSSPIVLVKKKSGEYRMCVDYRELNKITRKDRYPLPLIDDHLDSLKDKRFFTQLDLKNGYYHVKMGDSSVKYTSFVTPFGQYEYLKMPFGLCNGPACFQRYLNLIFDDLIRNGKVLIYFDDILIATKTIDENLVILKEVLNRMVENKLELKLDKCNFLETVVTYLGYVISEDGIKPNPDNVKIILDYPVPTNIHEVQRFLGLTSYFRRFIPKFSIIAAPLYALLKKNVVFNFGESELESFNSLRNHLVEQPLLSVYSPFLETELHCDASSQGFGAVLMQKQVTDKKWHPVFYFSKRSSETERKYHSFELEALAIKYSLERFRVYLYGIKFRIVTDCNALKLTFSKRDVSPRVSRWMLTFQQFNYELEHRSAERMMHVDALSRSILVVDDEVVNSLCAKQCSDPEILSLLKILESKEHPLFELRNGVVYRKISKDQLRFYVPEKLRESIVRTYHDNIGHVGVDKTCEMIGRLYWFPKMKDFVKNYINNCLKCIIYSPKSGKKEGFLHPIPKGDVPFDTIHVDHCGPFACTFRKNKYIFVVVDAFTKFVRLYPCHSTSTKEVVKHLSDYFRAYSKPNRIISDRGSCFTSTEFKEFLDLFEIDSILNATATPRANGQVERVNRSLSEILSKISSGNDWDLKLPDAEFSLNNTINKAVNNSPCQLLFGINQNGRIPDNLGPIVEDLGEMNVTRDINAKRASASENIKRSQDYSKKYFDKSRKPVAHYQEGDLVMLPNNDVTPGVSKKLLPRFKGPYEVKRVLPNDRYAVGEVEGAQVGRVPYKGVAAPDHLKHYIN